MYLQDKVNDINRRLSVMRNFSNIVIWGAGIHTCKLFEKTELLTYAVTNIVDMDKNKQGSPCFGFRIKLPAEIEWNDVEAVIISVPGKEIQIEEILKRELKYTGNIIMLYEDCEVTPFFYLYDKKIPMIQYSGDYADWAEASKECEGYDDDNIISTVIEAVDKVVNGDAVWERDGCLFYEQKFNYHICAAILKCAIQNRNQGVRILDIGGSLGSTYFQNRKYLKEVQSLEYIVAEQDRFAEYGRGHLEDGILKFIYSSEDYASYGKFDIVLMSASLQYIEQYEEVIDHVIRANPRYIILDRIPVSNKTRICKECVPEKICKSSYPLHIFRDEELNNYFGDNYTVVEKDSSSVAEDMAVYFSDGTAIYKCYVFKNIPGGGKNLL